MTQNLQHHGTDDFNSPGSGLRSATRGPVNNSTSTQKQFMSSQYSSQSDDYIIPSTLLYKLRDVEKSIADGKEVNGTKRTTAILQGINLEIETGDFIGVVGHSGAGKTTLLNILGGLDTVSGGELLFKGERVRLKNSRDMARFRRQIGFVFQSFQLINHFSVYDNVAIPLRVAGVLEQEIRQRVLRALSDVEMIKSVDEDALADGDHLPRETNKRLQQLPATLSGGEKQRVAIARAIVTRPSVLLADEPTGSLDINSATIILELLEKIHSDDPKVTVLVVSHSPAIVERFSRVIKLANGRIEKDYLQNPNRSS